MVKKLSDINLSSLKAPFFFAWHLTNRCNLNCIHCLWESGPDAAWPNELNAQEALQVCQQIVDIEIPYVALSGGEPLLHPAIWDICYFLTKNGIDIKIETNGHLINDGIARKLASFNLRSIQVSVDGASQETYSTMRPRAKLDKALKAIKALVKEGVVTEIVYVPAKFNVHEVEKLVDAAVEIGVKAFYTGKTMYIGRAVKNWDVIGLSDKENAELSRRLEAKANALKGRMSILFYPYSVIEELKYRLEYPPASPLLLANGKVKLIGSMPFVCGDVRKHSLSEIWQRFVQAWKHPQVTEYVNLVLKDASYLSHALDFVPLEM